MHRISINIHPRQSVHQHAITTYQLYIHISISEQLTLKVHNR